MEVDKVEQNKEANGNDSKETEADDEYNLFVTRQGRLNHTGRDVTNAAFCPYYPNIFAILSKKQVNIFDITHRGNYIGTVSNYNENMLKDSLNEFSCLTWIKIIKPGIDSLLIIGTNIGNIYCLSLCWSKIINIYNIYDNNTNIKYIYTHNYYKNNIIITLNNENILKMVNINNGKIVYENDEKFLNIAFKENSKEFIGINKNSELLIYNLNENESNLNNNKIKYNLIKKIRLINNLNKKNIKLNYINISQIKYINNNTILINNKNGEINFINYNNGEFICKFFCLKNTIIDINKFKNNNDIICIDNNNEPKIYNFNKKKITKKLNNLGIGKKFDLKYIYFINIKNEYNHLLGIDKDGYFIKLDNKNHVKLFCSTSHYFENYKKFDCQTNKQMPFYTC